MGEHYSQIDVSEHHHIKAMRDVGEGDRRGFWIVTARPSAEKSGAISVTIVFPDRWSQEYQGYFCTNTQRYARN